MAWGKGPSPNPMLWVAWEAEVLFGKGGSSFFACHKSYRSSPLTNNFHLSSRDSIKHILLFNHVVPCHVMLEGCSTPHDPHDTKWSGQGAKGRPPHGSCFLAARAACPLSCALKLNKWDASSRFKSLAFSETSPSHMILICLILSQLSALGFTCCFSWSLRSTLPWPWPWPLGQPWASRLSWPFWIWRPRRWTLRSLHTWNSTQLWRDKKLPNISQTCTYIVSITASIYIICRCTDILWYAMIIYDRWCKK